MVDFVMVLELHTYLSFLLDQRTLIYSLKSYQTLLIPVGYTEERIRKD